VPFAREGVAYLHESLPSGPRSRALRSLLRLLIGVRQKFEELGLELHEGGSVFLRQHAGGGINLQVLAVHFDDHRAGPGERVHGVGQCCGDPAGDGAPFVVEHDADAEILQPLAGQYRCNLLSEQEIGMPFGPGLITQTLLWIGPLL
jgi:hypothetical protein